MNARYLITGRIKIPIILFVYCFVGAFFVVAFSFTFTTFISYIYVHISHYLHCDCPNTDYNMYVKLLMQ